MYLVRRIITSDGSRGRVRSADVSTIVGASRERGVRSAEIAAVILQHYVQTPSFGYCKMDHVCSAQYWAPCKKNRDARLDSMPL